MPDFDISHEDEYGERHHIGTFSGPTGNDALAEMLRQTGADDDGRFHAARADTVARVASAHRGTYPITVIDEELL